MSPERSQFLDLNEKKKRRREWIAITALGLLLLILTWIEFNLFETSRDLPFVHSIFFFGLVNFNIILFLLLMFLIFRNIVKNFSEKEGGLIGSTLKGKLIAAFVGFSFVPTALMFLVSVFYINNSFDKWFSEKMAGVLKSSLEVTNAYYMSAKKKNYHFAHSISDEIEHLNSSSKIFKKLQDLRDTYRLDAVEYYPTIFDDPLVVVSKEENVPRVPQISLEFRKKGIEQKVDASTIHHFGEGNLIRVIVPVGSKGIKGAVVVSSFVPLSLIAKMDDIASAYEDFRGQDVLAYPLKSIYLIILVLMTLVILLGATWVGFYLAKQLSIPLVKLGWATQRVAQGDYQEVELNSGSPEINELLSNFNLMTKALARSEGELSKANKNLRFTLAQLDERTKYIEVVLSDVNTGVISLDDKGRITMVNRHAEKLLQIKAIDFIGKTPKELLGRDQFLQFFEMVRSLKFYNGQSIQKNIQTEISGRQVPLQVSLSLLHDEEGNDLGKVMVFDDLTMLRNTQRSQAWREVARRIAHEIKNPLTPISLSAQRLQKKFGSEVQDPAFKDCTSMIIDQVDGLKTLVNEFSQFARMPKAMPVVADLNRCIEESLNLFSQAHKRISFTFQADRNLPVFLFDPDQMKRVITNLVDNAVSAIGDSQRGAIALRTDFDNMLKLVRISISDDGPGIPSSMIDRIFEPYITTKTNGTGLGLAIVKRTVEDHNGFIRAYNNPEGGSRIMIELPVVKKEIVTEITSNNYDDGLRIT